MNWLSYETSVEPLKVKHENQTLHLLGLTDDSEEKERGYDVGYYQKKIKVNDILCSNFKLFGKRFSSNSSSENELIVKVDVATRNALVSSNYLKKTTDNNKKEGQPIQHTIPDSCKAGDEDKEAGDRDKEAGDGDKEAGDGDENDFSDKISIVALDVPATDNYVNPPILKLPEPPVLKPKSLRFSIPSAFEDYISSNQQGILTENPNDLSTIKYIPVRSFSAKPVPHKARMYSKSRPKSAQTTTKADSHPLKLKTVTLQPPQLKCPIGPRTLDTIQFISDLQKQSIGKKVEQTRSHQISIPEMDETLKYFGYKPPVTNIKTSQSKNQKESIKRAVTAITDSKTVLKDETSKLVQMKSANGKLESNAETVSKLDSSSRSKSNKNISETFHNIGKSFQKYKPTEQYIQSLSDTVEHGNKNAQIGNNLLNLKYSKAVSTRTDNVADDKVRNSSAKISLRRRPFSSSSRLTGNFIAEETNIPSSSSSEFRGEIKKNTTVPDQTRKKIKVNGRKTTSKNKGTVTMISLLKQKEKCDNGANLEPATPHTGIPQNTSRRPKLSRRALSAPTMPIKRQSSDEFQFYHENQNTYVSDECIEIQQKFLSMDMNVSMHALRRALMKPNERVYNFKK